MSKAKRSHRLACAGGYDSKDEQETVFDVSSLVDVGFLLLIYFLVTSTLLPRESDLEIDLMGKVSTEVVKLPPVNVKVSENGDVLMGEVVIDAAGGGHELPGLLEKLEPYVTASAETKSPPAVVIFAENHASQQRLVDVLNTVAKAGITNVTFDSGWYGAD